MSLPHAPLATTKPLAYPSSNLSRLFSGGTRIVNSTTDGCKRRTDVTNGSSAAFREHPIRLKSMAAAEKTAVKRRRMERYAGSASRARSSSIPAPVFALTKIAPRSCGSSPAAASHLLKTISRGV